MKKQMIHVSFAILLLITACSKESELKKSVFIPDAENPSLPAYTEWGYNTFGALYERDIFIYNDREIPAKIISTGGITSFVLKGQLGASGYYYSYDSYDMSLSFDLKDFVPSAYTDLVELNDTIFDLTQPDIQVFITLDTIRSEVHILEGGLEFKRAQQLIVDTKQIEVILSGHFKFQALVDEEPVSITEGRFDVGIGADNFYHY